uniref:Uncharacterized protein n=1 Tax=Rhizophora mucronata TaxID=61149 RepID=A0A2P2QZH4_RHIMU
MLKRSFIMRDEWSSMATFFTCLEISTVI